MLGSGLALVKTVLSLTLCPTA